MKRSNWLVFGSTACITVLELAAMLTGHNGQFFSASIGAICLLAGVKLKDFLVK